MGDLSYNTISLFLLNSRKEFDSRVFRRSFIAQQVLKIFSKKVQCIVEGPTSLLISIKLPLYLFDSSWLAFQFLFTTIFFLISGSCYSCCTICTEHDFPHAVPAKICPAEIAMRQSETELATNEGELGWNTPIRSNIEISSNEAVTLRDNI